MFTTLRNIIGIIFPVVAIIVSRGDPTKKKGEFTKTVFTFRNYYSS